jgi:hypothetical protein
MGNDRALQTPADPFQYKNVHVLLFCREEDDAGGWGEMTALSKNFEPSFGYNVRNYRTPNGSPYQQVERALRQFKRQSLSPKDLLIVYFNGHGNFDDRVTLRAYPRG